MGLVKTMVGLSYIKMEDVPHIPRRRTPLQAAVYAPLTRTPLTPDVVLVRGNARQLMLLAEAAQSAGVAGTGPTLGRPTCAVLPEAINTTRTAASFGCVGNRVYTGAGDTDAYFAIPGQHLEAVERSLLTILQANQELEKFHRARADGASPERMADESFRGRRQQCFGTTQSPGDSQGVELKHASPDQRTASPLFRCSDRSVRRLLV